MLHVGQMMGIVGVEVEARPGSPVASGGFGTKSHSRFIESGRPELCAPYMSSLR